MGWRLPTFIVGGMRKLAGIIQPRKTQTIHRPTFQWEMNHLDDCFHHWHGASGPHKDYFLPCSNGISLQEFNRLYIQISNKVAYRDPENGSLAIGKGQVHMPPNCLSGKLTVPFLFNCWVDNQFRSVSFDLQWLKLWILFTGHTSMAYNKCEWKIDHWLIISTGNSLHSPRYPPPFSVALDNWRVLDPTRVLSRRWSPT